MKRTNNKIIAWEKFQSPFKEMQNQIMQQLQILNNDHDTDTAIEDENDGYDMYQDSYEEYEDKLDKTTAFMGHSIPLIHDKYKNFNIWTGHTTKRISKNVLQQIINIEGTEGVEVVSPYRMNVAVGKLFKPRDVLYKINQIFINLHDSGTNV